MPSNVLALAVGVVLAFGRSASSKGADVFRSALILAVSLFMASYNATKLPESDLRTYMLYSELVSQRNFAEALEFSSEPVYYLGNWFFVGVLGFEFSSWIFLTTFTIFYLILGGIKRILEVAGVHGGLIASAIVLTAFFPLMFAQSGHLVRQYLAIAIGMLAMARYIGGERCAPYLILAAMTHVTAAIFMLVPIVAFVAPRFGRFSWILTYGLPVVAVGVARFLSEFSSNLRAIGVPDFFVYGLSRLGQQRFHALSDFSLAGYLFVAVSIGISIMFVQQRIAYKLWEASSASARMHTFVSIQLMLSLTVLALSIFGLSELAVRFSQFLFVMCPIALVSLISFHLWARGIVYILAISMPVLFFAYPSPWVYGNAIDILFGPYHVFAFNRPS